MIRDDDLKPMGSPVPGMLTWGAMIGDCSYIVSFDAKCLPGEKAWGASYRKVGEAVTFLGAFSEKGSAVAALNAAQDGRAS